jgi:hypothetical protein
MAASKNVSAPKRKASDVKPRLFMRGVLQGKTRYQAAIDAGYGETTAAEQCNIMRSVATQFSRALDRELPIEEMAHRIVQGCDATIPPFCTPRGELIDPQGFPDWNARHKYLHLAAQIMGLLTRRVELSGSGPHGEIELAHRVELARKRIVERVIEAEEQETRDERPETSEGA